MDGIIRTMLNLLTQGGFGNVSKDLLLSPDQYNSSLYQAAVTLHETAVLPVTAVVLSIVSVLAISTGATRMDMGDQQLGVRMIAAAMFRIAIVITITQNALHILKAIDEIVREVTVAANNVNFGGGGSSGTRVGEELSDQIGSLGLSDKLVVIILLLIPFLLATIVSALTTVLIFVRFLQLYVMTCFVSLPVAFWGMEETKDIPYGYVKSYASTAFQGAVLLISLKMYQALMASWASDGMKINADSDVMDLVVNNLGQFFVGPLVLAGVIFGASTLSKKIIGDR
ncbi:type IV secretion system protein [Kineococcus sp. SYSU DK003]|uniref:type IV secretion system protein n=1 Tax=Kineococcus sp. SYSU DK003 TaxID=3383124 RepID=UPI003D7D06D9